MVTLGLWDPQTGTAFVQGSTCSTSSGTTSA